MITGPPSALPRNARTRLLHRRLSRRTALGGLLATTMLALANRGRTSPQSATPAASTLLPRDILLPVEAVQDVIPGITSEVGTGPNLTTMGTPTTNRSVTYARQDGAHRVVLSVDRYATARDAQHAFDAALAATREVPGVTTEAVSGLGEAALIGVVTQGSETHVGGGALFGTLIVSATLQTFDGTDENKARAAELIRIQAEHAAGALGLSPVATPTA
ncbi:MAG: hypothetical protein U0Z70_11415 [Thermomicrobiales bacterium]